ncbi:tRNA (adenosine(37)-N6)-threonylcarbamoyltransferase complex dimerization subunit type 1 TsaB [Rhodocyclus tenuis]|uniref:tRNA (Adenosine(37)-N6)-threonylcarbamoyltransferase complex dimerization subunit type 1 TsaB n=1 Tax=Rhodocyclus gracilis TaxID=2929842 RepID=A0ABX0WJM4_9RHOO|nr:tRNA (adenosine(37)-N6)-threonylcarbamoyltransferase complex dimerization subunit type 1 TsaB [Rhodocyclus gracilis]MRD73802.1 tRNA (adenosine(37)-N6)-threonylcarbamoyltransferase complex dimerization subunit type 1 TsaB [Rhodocyclus gracilis]NJA89922.1 tRNA (adenosine(37)-N6)-threonylcarbamoyltransferase complex dimerization subunit type 1 TsaB [Rhodocyclus gracilis]
MNLLALETSTDTGSVALWLDGALSERVFVTGEPAGSTHSHTLLPAVRALLDAASLRFADLDGIAFGNGPGAFTGLRVACAVSQGLAAAHDLPLIPVSTLEAMALSSGGKRVLVALDARMGEVYWGVYCAGVAQAPLIVAAPQDVPLPEGTGWLACGNGLAAYPVLAERLQAKATAFQPQLMPAASAVARLAAPRLARGERVAAADAVPVYVRDKVALTVAERLAQGGRA